MDIYTIILGVLGIIITGLGIAVGKLSGGKKSLVIILKALAIGGAETIKELKKMSDEDEKVKKVLDKEKIPHL